MVDRVRTIRQRVVQFAVSNPMVALRATKTTHRTASVLVSQLQGSLCALVYAFHVDKLPIILGYLFLPFLYARNLKLLRRIATPETTP